MALEGVGSGHQTTVDLSLVPYPHSVSIRGSPLRPLPSMYLHISAEASATLRRRAQILAQQFTAYGTRTSLAAATHLQHNQALLTSSPTVAKRWEQQSKPLRGMAMNPEGYRLSVTSEGALIQGQDERGLFWGGQTLLQIIETGREVPGMEIEDGPLLPYRAIHLDLRGWPPTREYIERTIDRLARCKINVLILEYERHFQFNSQHGLAHRDAFPASYVAELDLYAKDRGIQLVPLLHCIGNLNYLLRLDAYKEIREDPRFFQQACPTNSTTTDIYIAMAEDLLAVHSSNLFHIGGDQARFLGGCPACKNRAKILGGRASLYLEYIGKITRYMESRQRHVLLWDGLVSNMNDEQINWLSRDTVLCFMNSSGQGGRATPTILTPLDRYKQLGRRVWGTSSRLPMAKFENFDNIDAWTEAAEMGYLEGLILATWTREFAQGPLLAPPEIAWPAALYGAERAWGGRKNTKREDFLARFAGSFFGVQERQGQERLWGVFDLLIREYPRETREMIRSVHQLAHRNRETLEFLDAWCRLGAFQYYLEQFEKACAANYDAFQNGTADPFHGGRLHWRIEDLKAHVSELTKTFRTAAARISTPAAAEEFLNCNLAYGVRRLDEMGALLDGYPSPEKEWQQPVKGV